MTVPLLKAEHISKWFPVKGYTLRPGRPCLKAVSNVSFEINEGETLGIVGESGCGKSTLGRTIIKLLTPTEGRLIYKGIDITSLSEKKFRPYRKEIQIMFQDPYASLDPRMTVGDCIAEPMDVQKLYTDTEARLRRIVELMDVCGLNRNYINRYPHEFSGGQRQRIGIARALSVNPSLIICDEPVSALDVSIQSQIINLLMTIQKNMHLSLIFISHDLSVVHYISTRIMVMYLGNVVEIAEKKQLFSNPLHPYTRALLQAVPVINGNSLESMQILDGELPSPVDPPPGCVFHTRCPCASPFCSDILPSLHEVEKGHWVACIKKYKTGSIYEQVS
jgi:oligopeptide/dipeptide ABC transporter ATP-binding protein